MSLDNQQEKTEEPTQQRLEKAREEGQIFMSKDLNLWVLLLCFFFCFCYWFPKVFYQIMIESSGFFSFHIQNSYRRCFYLLIMIISVCFCFALSPFVSGLIQSQGLFSLKLLSPKLEKLSLKKGLKRIFSKENLEEFLKNLVKLLIFLSIIFFVIKIYLPEMTLWMRFSLLGTALFFKAITMHVLSAFLITFFIIAVFDFFWQKKNYMQKMRMSIQEVKDEYKETEGDPKIRTEMKRRQTTRRRLNQVISKATVVITNPIHFSVVLEWDEDKMMAPKITAKGIDNMALHIQELAQENHIPIFSNPPLARSLYHETKIDDFIPPEYYKVVADIIRFVKGIA